MFGLGVVETGIILVVAVVLFGSQAPKLVGKFFQTSKDVKKAVSEGMDDLKDDKKSASTSSNSIKM